MKWACDEYIQAPHKDTSGREANCCRRCNRTKEAHAEYKKYKEKRVIIWNNRRYTFKNVEDMMKNRFFPG
jgi:hypothetical protein